MLTFESINFLKSWERGGVGLKALIVQKAGGVTFKSVNFSNLTKQLKKKFY